MSDLNSIAQENIECDVILGTIPGISGAIEFGWVGYLAGENYRNALNNLVDLIDQEKCRLILHDYSRIRVIHPGDQSWFKNRFIPRLNDTSIVKSFMIQPLEPMALDSLMHIAQKCDPFIRHEIIMFDNREEAFAALKAEAFRV